jgi:beta-galactosidase
MNRFLILGLTALFFVVADARETYNFNSNWLIDNVKNVTLPHAWNEDESFKVPIAQMSDTVMWYRKYFRLPKSAKGQRVFIEFEGARQAAEVWLNGHRLGICENGVMAFGFELTKYIKSGDNLIEVRTDNDWNYKSPILKSGYQWNNKNFNANYGGLPKNVRLHVCPSLYQTLPLYSSLGTTGVYIYGSDFNIKAKSATINVESQVRNTSSKVVSVDCKVIVEDKDGNQIANFEGQKVSIAPGSNIILKASKALSGLHFWSWGYGYLYRVKTIVNNDTVTTITGFRKTEYGKGMFRLNDRVMMVHGFAQRTSNEWPGVGMSVPAWLSDYSNNLMIKGGGNLVRWMHVTPWKQDIESCDRVGLIQAMPAGDAEADVNDVRWQQRVDLMRDAIIYNRNNPSICFYECGNHGISKAHFLQMKSLRDSFDLNGGRAIGSREMLDIPESEYGGEMLYINKSDTHPMWMMEYCRDEGLRKYWNSWSYPYHKEGDGPLYRNAPAISYNHNQDEFAAELVRRWYDYWQERPGTGTMVNSGGVKIVFSDTQTHCRGAENYRRSGVVDAMRIPKDGFFAHQVMWDGWVDDLKPRTYIVGMWNYEVDEVIPRIYVVSNSDSVRLMVNGKPISINAKHQYRFLYEFDHVPYEAGTLKAVGYNVQGKEQSSYSIETAGNPDHLLLTKLENPSGWKADGADIALVQVEVVDKQGRRCPLDNRTVKFSLHGECEWRGGIAQGKDNYVLSDTLPVECGINRVMLRSTTKAGEVTLSASADGLESQSISLHTNSVSVVNGLSKNMPTEGLQCVLDRGETPITPSFIPSALDIPIKSVEVGSNKDKAFNSFDKNERSEWDSDGNLTNAWITYTLEKKVPIDNICIKFSAFRSKSYPIEVYAGDLKIWEGFTDKSLGYIHIPMKGVVNDKFTIRMVGESTDKDAFGAVTELDRANNEKKNSEKTILRIIETQFICKIKE